MDTVQRLESAWNAHSAGEFEPALQEYIALFDATGKDPETASLRLSYVLAAWARLAEEYVPARRALVEERDRLAAQLPSAPDAFHDVRIINDKLGDLQNTYHLFERLPDAQARQHAREALPSVMACGDYALARRFLPHPEQHLAQAAAQLNELKSHINVLTTEGMAELLADVFNYTTEVALVLDLLNGCGDTAAAERARQQAIDLVQAPEARACVQAELDTPGTTLDAMVELQNSVTA
ncbi:hypothetical protein GTP44_23365 [Duganella sp. FT50W]|uniref:Tetratricopeptide repeat protein n=1 Tax=Duganella lactea TaxID=2692173 RepID=A0A6L8MS28_9BURK|nr:hypothetical protein [Duganella lactea]MYM36533.1 hypothetical protein [Duganella lactea]MYM84873.1 hypothetical protein [Duganella lactea]